MDHKLNDSELKKATGGGGDYFPEIPYSLERKILYDLGKLPRAAVQAKKMLAERLVEEHPEIPSETMWAYINDNWGHEGDRLGYLLDNKLC